MKNKKIMRRQVTETLKNLTAKKQDKYTRIYFYGILKGSQFRATELVSKYSKRTGDILRKGPLSIGYDTRKRAIEAIEEMLNTDFLLPGDDPEYYGSNPEVIKTIVGHNALSNKDKKIVELIYLDPVEPKIRKRLRDKEIYKPENVNESWWLRTTNVLDGDEKLRFMDMLLWNEEKVWEQCMYFDTRLPINTHLNGEDGIARFLRDQMISRMSMESKINDVGMTLYYKQILTHLCILPYLNDDSKEFPFKSTSEGIGLKLPDCGLSPYWYEILNFIDKRDDNHFIPEFLGPGWRLELPMEFSGYLGGIINRLQKGMGKLKLQESPFVIQVDDKKGPLIQRLRELHEFLERY